jgi:hypothetical protein
MYEFTCMNCGKVHVVKTASTTPKKFCNRECWRQHNEKKRAAQHQTVRVTLSEPLIPSSQCEKCKYRLSLDGIWCCGYFDICGHTRTAMHPEGLTTECREFERRRQQRKQKNT